MFLLAHLFYIWSFSLSVNILSLKMLTKHEKISTLSACVGVIIILIINTSALWEKITNLPLFVSYGIVLSLMAIFALLRIGKVRGKAFWYVTLGALIFGVSDNLLATLKFNHIHTDIGRGIIMITYYGAQYLIVEGSVENQKNSK